MAKTRVHDLAKEYGMSSKEMLEHLADMKIPAKSASSTLEDAYVSIVRKKLKPILEARAAEIEAEKKAAAQKAAEEARAAAEQAEKERLEAGEKYFSVASGGGTGRTLHPDNMGAGPASYGMTDTMGRMHSDAQFAGSSSVPAHVDMMGLIGMGNNPMVGATVACAVAVEEALKA